MMQLPAMFGKYELEKFLGGGMSHVYRARDTVLGRTVAVKILTEEGGRDEDTRTRFLAEARMSANFHHDNVITIHDFGEIDGRPFIVMEFLVGEDLRTAMDAGHTGDLTKKLNIAVQAARALAYVNAQGVVHRDIKPENLHIDTAGRVRLMDFGIAKSQNLALTREGFAIGTPYYMSPEQVLGKPVTPATDVYAFGILLFEMITGGKAVSGETVEALFYLILHEAPDLTPLEKCGAPPALIELVARCIAKKPEERPQTFDALLPALEKVAAPAQDLASTTAIPTPSPRPAAQPKASKKSMLPLIAVAAAVVLAGGIGAYLFLDKKPVKEVQKKTVSPLPEKIQNDFGEMILVPQGKFLSGPDSREKELPAFYIDKTEVSVVMWNKFAQTVGRPSLEARGDLPVTGVNLAEAGEYCAWAKKRLPAFDEWEKAARGAAGQIYPWGNQPDASRANVKGNSAIPSGTLQPVESLAQGATASGLLHMTGNVWEWVQDVRKPSDGALKQFAAIKATVDEPWSSIRGGGMNHPIEFAVSHEFMAIPARYKAPDIGFRCAQDATR